LGHTRARSDARQPPTRESVAARQQSDWPRS
jgi:hypothetical protein